MSAVSARREREERQGCLADWLQNTGHGKTCASHDDNENVSSGGIRSAGTVSAGEILDRPGQGWICHCRKYRLRRGQDGTSSERGVGQGYPEAEIVLVEADGSRRLPLKVPGVNEPVIPEHVIF